MTETMKQSQSSTNLPSIFQSLGLLILRLGVGGYMLFGHGLYKAEMLQAEEIKFGDPIGVGMETSLYLAIFGEAVCAGLIMAGLLTRLASIPFLSTMAVAAFVVHGADPWLMQAAGGGASKEPAMLYFIPALTLLFTGPGMFSIDHLFFGRKKKQEMK
ncbi:Putative oxidoreductase [Planctomycetales bacterium 10988]|nr:Putative oxidoreductase [Planctomycetales bacterium 10988]